MNKWPHKVQTYAPSEVRTYAVQDPVWQKFREELKGLPTEKKLDRLHHWLRLGPASRRRQVQVDNYINALKRGGLLDKTGKVAK